MLEDQGKNTYSLYLTIFMIPSNHKMFCGLDVCPTVHFLRASKLLVRSHMVGTEPAPVASQGVHWQEAEPGADNIQQGLNECPHAALATGHFLLGRRLITSITTSESVHVLQTDKAGAGGRRSPTR